MNLKLSFALLGSFATVLAAAQDSGPLKISGSLFTAQSGRGVISSHIAFAKGDLLTIVVSEAQSGSTTASTSSAKTDATTVNAASLPLINALTKQFLKGTTGNLLNSALGGGSTGASSATAGTGASSTNTSFSANVTVVVKDVEPNGNLIIEGTRTIHMNKQTQILRLEGTVRMDDVSLSNTVLSQNVANLRISADGKGLIADRQREGFLTKILSWIF